MSTFFAPPKPPKIPILPLLPPDPAVTAAAREKALLERRRRARAGTTRTNGNALGGDALGGGVAPVQRPGLSAGGKSRLGE